jgi:hypothetical protein
MEMKEKKMKKEGMLCPVHKHLCTWYFSLNNGANSSWIRNSAISYEKKNISLFCIQIPENVAFYFSSKDQ